MKNTTLNLWLALSIIFSNSVITYACEVLQDCSTACTTQCSVGKNLFLPRAFSSNSSLEIMQEKNIFQVESDRNEWNGTFSFATTYGQNFGAKCNDCKNLGSLPFWSGTNVMIAGDNTDTAVKNGSNLDAFNFGMGNIDVDPITHIGGTITLNPKVTQIGTDFLLYMTHFKDKPGLFFKVHAPVGALSIDPQMSQNGINAVDLNYFDMITSGTQYDLTYATSYPALADRHATLTGAFAGGVGQDGSVNGHTANQPSLNYGRISTCKLTEIRLADLSVSLGYNFFACEKGFLGIGFKVTCPTGTVAKADYALEPIFGRGGVWGVGGELMSHRKIWQNEAETKYLNIWLQGEILHLFPGRTALRSFDLKANGVGSKYLLVQRYYQQPSQNSIMTPSNLQQAINITTFPVNSKFLLEGSVSLMADFHCKHWNLAIGGEFWSRSKENLSINMCAAIDERNINLNHYAVVGRQASNFNIISGLGGNQIDTSTVPFVPLCEPAAKINKAQDTITLVGAGANIVTFPTTIPTGLADARLSSNRIPANLTEALDICGAQVAKACTGKIFSQLGYTWLYHCCTPNLSLIGSAEFTNKTNNVVQMWSAGVQGSINF